MFLHLSLRLPLIVISIFHPLALVAEEVSTLQNAAYQAGVEQEQLRKQTRRLIADVSALLEEFRKNPAAQEEVALTESTLAKLQSLTDSEMAAVAGAFQEISRTPGDAGKLVAATRTAKEIQSTLSQLADKLALYQDEASLELRLIALLRRQLVNQRQARYLAEGPVRSNEEIELTFIEQKAIANESSNLMQLLERLAGNPAFSTTFRAGQEGQLMQKAEAALAPCTAKDFRAAVEAQVKVIAVLQSMLVTLNGSRSLEERLQAAEQKMRALAARQETLARTTTKSRLPEQRALARRQQEIADQRSIIEAEILYLSEATRPLLQETHQRLESMDRVLQTEPRFLLRPEQKSDLISSQTAVAQKFMAIAELLKKQGDALAAANGASPDQQAMSNAAGSILQAIDRMETAQQMLNNGGNSGAAEEQMNKAQGDLANAQSQLGNAGNSAPPGAADNLSQSAQSLGEGQSLASQPGASSSTRAKVGEAKTLAGKALADLQKTLDGMSGQMVAGAQSDSTAQQNQSQGTGGGAGWGSLFNHRNEYTSFSALAKLPEKQRAALATLQQEKAPPEYDTMARQYLKNLADGVIAGQNP